MLKKTLTAMVLGPMLIIASAASAAGGICSSHDKFATFLSDTYKESPRAIGLVANKRMMQVFVSQKGTWSILMTAPNGKACLLAAGDNWEGIKLVEKGPTF